MRREKIRKGTELDFIDGTFVCDGYNGSLVDGTFQDCDGNTESRALSYSDINRHLKEVDSKNHNVVWEEPSYEAQAKYDSKNTKQFKMKLNLNTDSDIIAWLENQSSMQGAIKELIRKELNR